jgi:hypothetical protein
VPSATSTYPKPAIISAIIWVAIACTLVALPLRVIQFGFLPPDDALRHAAKAVSGKHWSEILVLRPEITIDHNPGWHVLLTLVHRATGWKPRAIVILCVVSMFLLLGASPLRWLKRPEAWLASLALCMSLFPYLAERALIGRPLLLTMSVTFILLCLWTQPPGGFRGDSSNQTPGTGGSKMRLLGTSFLIALSTWIHGSWYLLILIPAAFFLARHWRKGFLLTACWVAGTILGACFTGQPLTFLHQSALIPLFAFRAGAHINAFVGEFQPFPISGAYPVLILMIIVCAWRKFAGKTFSSIWRDPVFWLAALGLLLGFRVLRFWLDWGLPAFALWLARQFEELLSKTDPHPRPRLIVTAVSSIALLALVANDRNARWSQFRFDPLDARRLDHAEWLPAPGGILYSVNLSVFYETFFTNPHGRWRYALGFEPSFMTAENLAVYDELCRTLNAVQSTVPWVRKMTPDDRLVLVAPPEVRPAIPDLEWHYAATNTWIGRRPTSLIH